MQNFVKPITDGQYIDSTSEDIRLMEKRSRRLHKLLDGCMQRKDYSVLELFLKPKHEYTLYIQLTKIQCKLYKVNRYDSDNEATRKYKQLMSILFHSIT